MMRLDTVPHHRADAAIQGMSLPRLWLLVLSSILLTACASGPYAPPPPDVVPPTPRSEPYVVKPAPPAQTPEQATQAEKRRQSSRTIAKGVRTERSRPSAAAQSMIEKARSARKSGDLPQATSMLERAQRMSPQAAEVYFELAAVKMAEGSYVQAEQLCQKALSLAGDDSRFRTEVWGQIAEIREARGDKRGADEARKNARRQG